MLACDEKKKKICILVTKSQCSQQNSDISTGQEILSNVSNRTQTKAEPQTPNHHQPVYGVIAAAS